MISILRNEKGVTLIELISVVLISTVLIAVSAVGVIAFYNSYNKISSYISLQQGVTETLHLIRYGMRMPATDSNLLGVQEYNPAEDQFWGISNAKEIELSNFQSFMGYSDRIKMIPAASIHGNDYLEYYLDSGTIRATYIYKGNRVPSPLYIFPKKKDADLVEVTSFKITNENDGLYFRLLENNPVTLVGIEIEARVLLKDDPLPYKREYQTVKYKSTIAKKHTSK